MKVRYEFDLERDSCADCPLMISDDDYGYYTCAPTGETLGLRNYKEIWSNKRPEYCPLQVVENQLNVQKSDNKQEK